MNSDIHNYPRRVKISDYSKIIQEFRNQFFNQQIRSSGWSLTRMKQSSNVSIHLSFINNSRTALKNSHIATSKRQKQRKQIFSLSSRTSKHSALDPTSFNQFVFSLAFTRDGTWEFRLWNKILWRWLGGYKDLRSFISGATSWRRGRFPYRRAFKY